ncbi:MAG: hypothetical protein KGJ05_05355 [Alphaproteobacteria bacterium]|nr:hypothetical protein [Alphaproteobacteria bacterium]MDE2339798.1 hypothetical protein [Alphaproteobacteria bacterium]
MHKPLYAERALLQDGEVRNAAPRRRARSVKVNLAESPLSWLHARGHISPRQFAAGEQLRNDYERAQLGARVTMAWDATPVSRARAAENSLITATNAQLAARQRFTTALEAAGPGLTDILWRVVCGLEALPEAEKALGWPTRSGKLVLMIALDRVAAYYRVP